MKSTPKSRKLAKKISRKLPVGRSTEFHKEATDYDRRENKRAIETELAEVAREAQMAADVKSAMDLLGLDYVPAEWVKVHFKCPYCGSSEVIKLTELMDPTFVCHECDNVENYMELLGITL